MFQVVYRIFWKSAKKWILVPPSVKTGSRLLSASTGLFASNSWGLLRIDWIEGTAHRIEFPRIGENLDRYSHTLYFNLHARIDER